MFDLLTPYEAAAMADRAETLAFADFFEAAPETVKTQLGLRVEHVADATLLIAPGTPITLFNRALGLGLQREADTRHVDAIVERYARAGSADWRLLWSPQANPADMPSKLAAQGDSFPAVSSWAKMWRGPITPSPVASPLTVARASQDQAHAVARVFVEAFGMPSYMGGWFLRLHGRHGWTVYAVKDGEEVVGGGCLFLAGAIAWLGMGAVAASHRRRGGQAALIARRIGDAIASGARHLFTETGEPAAGEASPSLNNMKRCGFTKVVSRVNLAGPSSAGVAAKSR
jgi:hypothetical protein